MKHFITLTALALAPFAAYAGDDHDHGAEKKAVATDAAKPAPICKDGCCEAETKPAAKPAPHEHEHEHAHGDDITLTPALVTKFAIVSEKLGAGKIARTTIATGTLAKDDSLAKAPALVVEAKVSERAAAKLKAGESRLRVTAPGGLNAEAIFHSQAPTPAAKGFTTARFILENKNGAIEPGSSAEFRLVTSEKEYPLTVPRTAIQGAKGKTFVYVEESQIGRAHV